MECVDLSVSDAVPLYEFYCALPETMNALFSPFPDLTPAVIRNHLEETETGRHISMGLASTSTIYGHGFVMDIRERHPVLGLGIRPSLQGQGWGRKLMDAVMGRAGLLGVGHITLTVVARNTRALELYRSYGFRVAAKHTFQEPDDSYIMRYDGDSS